MQTHSAKMPWKEVSGDIPLTLPYRADRMVDAVLDIARKYPNAVALDFMGNTVTYGRLAKNMGMKPNHIFVGEIGSQFELTGKTCKLTGTVPSGKVFVDGPGVGDVGSVVLRDRKHLAQDGMIVVCVNLSAQNGEIISGPDIITRGFIYVKESEELMENLHDVTWEAIERCQRKRIRDWSAIKTAIKNDLSGYLYKTTKRNPMILPVIMEV